MSSSSTALRQETQRRPQTAELCVIAAFFASPMSGVGRLGFGMILTDVLLTTALLLLLGRRRARGDTFLQLTWAAGGLLVGVQLLVGGLLVGEAMRGATSGELLTVLAYGAGALLPTIVLSVRSLNSRVYRQAALALGWGAVASVIYGLGTPTGPSGRIVGLASHQNQLAMSVLIALPIFTVLWRRRHVRLVLLLALLLCGLLLSGSRSGLVGLAAMTVFAAWRWGAGTRIRLAVLLISGALLAVSVASLGGSAPSDDPNALSRLQGSSSAQASNSERRELLDSALSVMSPVVVAVGTGFALERSPHNAFLEVLIAGGITALAGLLTIVVTILRRVLSQRRRIPPLSLAAGLGAIAYFAAVAFNSNLWVRFAWCTLALVVAVRTGPQLAPRQVLQLGFSPTVQHAPPDNRHTRVVGP